MYATTDIHLVNNTRCVFALKRCVLIPIKPYSIRLCDFLKYSQVFSRSSRKKKNGKESQPAWTKTKPLYVKLTDQNRTVTVSLFTILDERENDLLLHYLRECITRSSDSPLDGKSSIRWRDHTKGRGKDFTSRQICTHFRASGTSLKNQLAETWLDFIFLAIPYIQHYPHV